MKYFYLIFAMLFFALNLSAQVTTSDSIQIGKPGSSANKEIKFGAGRGAKPGIRYNTTNSKLEFSNDASIFKALGSGSGSGAGINLLDNPGFEDGIGSNWTTSGTSLVSVTSGANLLFDLISASWTPSTTGHYFESNAVVIPNGLYGAACMAEVWYQGGDANAYLTVFNSSTEIIPTNARAVLNATAGIKKAKIYFDCPSSGSLKLRVQSTAAMAVAYFDKAHLGQADFNGVSNTIPATPYTPTITGFGTVTNLQAFYARRQDMLKVWGAFTVGTSTAVSARISLPNIGGQLNLDTNKILSLQRQRLGFATKALVSTTTQMPAVTVGPFVIIADTATSTSEVFFSVQTNTTANHYLVATGTNVSASSGEMVNFEFEVPISGWSVLENSVNAKCVNDVACENIFHAFVTTAGVVAGENLDWISGNCSGGASQSCTLSITGLANPLLCYGVPTENGAASTARVFTPNRVLTTTTAIAWNTYQSGTGNVSSDVNITCVKQGSDFKSKQSVQAFFSTMLTPAGFSARSSSGQSIPSGVATTLVMANENYDSHNGHDTGTGVYTVQDAGKYSCSCRYTYASFTPATSSLTAQIVKNGVLAAENYYTVGTTPNTYSQQVTFNDSMVNGDQIRCAAFQNTGSAKSLAANTVYNEFSCNKVGN